MRVGECTDRVKRNHIQFPRVTVCILVRIPHHRDYYAHRFDVLKLCLASLRANTPPDLYELLVFDNGSCDDVVDHLRAEHARGAIDYLLLSKRNVGKIHACRMMFDAAPGEIVAYSDDDVWFGPDWLGSQLEIVDAFPRVGMVSARPVRRQFGYGNTFLPRYLEEFADITSERGHFIPDEWEREYMRSTGKPEDEAAVIAAAHVDVVLERAGVRAYATATHFQFVAPRPVILAALAKRDQPRTGSEERQFEEALEAMGYVRLSTAGRHVRHIGNVIDRALAEEISLPLEQVHVLGRPSMPSRVWRAALTRINRWSHRLLDHR